ncbi:MAG: hypothetical protein HY717_19175 [Planctomycetes bacterium]|nr:hypothetical protein [Planctomycetota bacterium]
MSPVAIGPGPLFFFKRPEESPLKRWEEVFVVDPESSLQPQRFLNTPGNLIIEHRLDRHRILVYSYPSSRRAPEGYFIMDLEKGSAAQLLKETHGRQIFELKGICIALSPRGESSEPLAFAWLDEERIRYSESRFSSKGEEAGDLEFSLQWVDVDVKTGKKLGAGVYWPHIPGGGFVQQCHSKPRREVLPAPGTPAPGLFEKRQDMLFFKGETEPLVSFRTEGGGIENEEIHISREGEWAAFVPPGSDHTLWLASGKTRNLKAISQGWGYGFTWLPRFQTE